MVILIEVNGEAVLIHSAKGDYSLYPKSPRGQRRDEERKHCIHAGAARE